MNSAITTNIDRVPLSAFPTVVLAFLQNPHFVPGTPENIIEFYRDDPDYHRDILAASMSGARIKKAFGKLFKEIIWDNANWRPGTRASTKMPADPEHMQRQIDKYHPTLIITFGTEARDALLAVTYDCPALHCHHPNARFKTQKDLEYFADQVQKHIVAQS